MSCISLSLSLHAASCRRALSLLLVFTAHFAPGQTYTLSRFAGLPSGGYADATGAEAQFSFPSNVVVDGEGNIIVVDSASVRKISPTQVVTTLTTVVTQRKWPDGSWPGRILGAPGLASDRGGNVFFADNHAVWKIAPTGETSLRAGAPGEAGTRDGSASAARFDFSVLAGDFFPDVGFGNVGLAVTDGGVLFVADVGNHTIRRISPSGEVTTVAGRAASAGFRDGTGDAARFYQPERIALDPEGNLLVADVGNEVVRKVTPDGQVSTLNGKIGRLSSVAVDKDGSVYVGTASWWSDPARYPYAAIYRLQTTGERKLIAGSESAAGGDDGRGAAARFSYPLALAVHSNGGLIVADSGNRAIRQITPAGEVTTLAGASPAHINGIGDSARFRSIRKMTIDAADNVYVLDDSQVRKITPAREVTTVATLDASLESLGGIAVDRKSNVLVSTVIPSLVKVTPEGAITTLWSSRDDRGVKAPPPPLRAWPQFFDIGVDSTGAAFVGAGAVILKFSPDGSAVVFAGDGNVAGRSGTTGSVLLGPDLGLTIDLSDNLVLSDSSNHVVRKIDSRGVATTLAGDPSDGGWVDGVEAEARLDHPTLITTNSRGTVFVYDSFSRVVRKIANGRVSTIALLPPSGVDNFYVTSMAADASDALFLSVGFGSAIWKAAPTNRDASSGLINLSVQAELATEQPLTAGITAVGGETTLLMRGVGPGLEPFVAGSAIASEPRLDLFESTGRQIGASGKWSDQPALIVAAAATGAFPLPRGSTDAALLRTLDRQASARLTVTTPGLALLEMFALPRNEGGRITNLSARHSLVRNASLIAGFATKGTATDLLIRGIGPSLRQPPFGIADSISGAVLTLFDSLGRVIAINAQWSPELSPIFTRAGAFPLESGSKDAAIRLTLPAGTYTASLVAADGLAGQAMIEIYEVP